MKPKTTLFGLILVLVMAVVIGGVWMLVRQTLVQRQVLPDGTVVALKGVTFGRQHRLATGTLWQQLAGRLLPSDLARRFGIPVLTYVTTNDSLMVWWEQTTQSGVRTANFAVPVVAIADDQGNEFTSANVAFRLAFNPSSQASIFELVPRDNERISVRMRFTDPYARTDFAVKFEVKNPAPKFRSRWVATSLPVTARGWPRPFVLPSRASPATTGKCAAWKCSTRWEEAIGQTWHTFGTIPEQDGSSFAAVSARGRYGKFDLRFAR